MRFDCEPEGILVGVEHEYRLFDQDRQVDFRGIIHSFDLGTRHLDPTDPYAYRLDSGAALTCDEAEAEVALPPVPLRPGFAGEIAARAAAERARLQQLVPGLRVEGYSTHVSVTTPAEIGDRSAQLYLRTAAPALMLLMNRPTSPGLLVRPRPGRTELGGEFVDGTRLQAVAVFAAGSVLACRAAEETATAPKPTPLAVRAQDDDHRYGWFVDRCAFGGDLYRSGRHTELACDGGTKSAQAHLEAAWAAARQALIGKAAEQELQGVDQLVHGEIPLPSEQAHAADQPAPAFAPPSPFSEILRPRRRAAFEMAPVMVTWDTTVLVIVNPSRRRRAFACVPRRLLAGFFRALDEGALDVAITTYLDRPPPRLRVLRTHSQTATVGLYDRLGHRRRLLPRERAAQAGGK